MGAKGRDGEGLKYLGLRNGRKWWEARLPYIDPRTGQKKSPRKQYQADTKALAVQERERLLEEKRTGKAAPSRDERHRVNEAIDLYLASIKTHSTLIGRTSAAKHIRKAFGEWFVDTVTADHLQDYLDAHPQSVPQRNALRAILSLSFDEAMRKRWITTHPAKGLVVRARKTAGRKKSLPPKRSLTLDEAALYLSDIKEHEPWDTYLILHTQLVLGCRFGEVSDLTWDDVDLESGFVVISHAQFKGKEGETKGRYARPSGIDLWLRNELKKHREAMAEHKWPGWETLVFPRAWSPRQPRKSNHHAESTIYKAVKRSLKRIGLGHMPVGTHLARHTMQNVSREYASALLLRKVMGHTSEQVQLNYTAAEKAEVINLAERVGSAFRDSRRQKASSGDSGSGPRSGLGDNSEA
jgi:integrase